MNEGICTALRVAWIRFLIQSNRLTIQPKVKYALTDKLAGPCRNHVKQVAELIHARIIKPFDIFAQQCHMIAGQRIWRAFQILTLYRQLYGEKRLLQAIGSNFLCRCKGRNLYMLLSAAGLFQWERDGVSNEEMERASAEMESLKNAVAHPHLPEDQKSSSSDSEIWEIVINRPHLKIWRRPMGRQHLFEYKIFGTFNDIPASAFYATQIDLDFWAGWDEQTLKINIVDQEQSSGSTVIHWIYKYPYPMYPRDYCYVRRHMIDKEKPQCVLCKKVLESECMLPSNIKHHLETSHCNVIDTNKNKMIIRAKAVKHQKCPELNSIVRVTDYLSQMVISPHTTFDANGFDYYMIYFDDPQTQLPSMAYNWLASTGVPDFVDRLHSATKVMQERMKGGYKPHLTSPTPPKQVTSPVLPSVQNYC